MLSGVLSVGTRNTVGLGGLLRNVMDLRGLMSNGSGLRGHMSSGVGSVMAKDRQEHTPFQVFDAGREFDAAADNSTTSLIDAILGQHGPSWANQIMNSHARSANPHTATRTREVDLAGCPTFRHDASRLNAARAVL
jgi:hypothetical protein